VEGLVTKEQLRVTESARRFPRRTLPVVREEASEVDLYDRPQTRGDCLEGGINAQRPCPWAGCRHHLLTTINPQTGSVTLIFGHDDVTRLKSTCALDVVDEHGGLTLGEVGDLLGEVSRERIRQIEMLALRRALRDGAADGLRVLLESNE
jgi:hypothetical protein